MGGLVVRSALQHGLARSAPWVRLVRHTVHLGVPHLGAPLERAGRVGTSLLRSLPNPWTRLVGTAADLRSAGVKDLAGGDLVPDGTWVPLPLEGMHHAIIGTLHRDPHHVLSWLLGDGLVPIASARAQRYGGAEVFPPERIRVSRDPRCADFHSFKGRAPGYGPPSVTRATTPELLPRLGLVEATL